MPDFLLELRCEEIPARMQPRASADLARLFAELLAAAGLTCGSIETWATPRRLALIARGLPQATEPVREELKGPRAGAPDAAVEGFLRKTGLQRTDLVERDGTLFASIDRPGRATSQMLAEAIPALIRAFPWPKSMRWGEASVSTDSLRWVRPFHGIVALLGDAIVEFEVGGISSGAATLGHRFHHPGAITIGSAADYVEKLRACRVILDPAERKRIIAEGAAAAAQAAGLNLVEDEGLLEENAGLTEWPVPLLGHFDEAFLDVPREVIQLTMRNNQKYFSLLPATGRGTAGAASGGGGAPPAQALAPAFVCVANIEADDGGEAIVAGNRKVLAARLADARYFWEHDLKVPLEEQAKKLSQIVFHEKLGTVADKVERIARLTRWLVEEEIIPLPAREGKGVGRERSELADLAERAARLCKADLVTGLVGEFPELEGIVGGYLARAQGEPDEVAGAIRDHYRPVGQGDEVPTAPVTVAVSLADKLDTLASFFVIREIPTGSKDPFALRRAAISILRVLEVNQIRMPVAHTVIEAVSQLPLSQQALDQLSEDDQEFVREFGPVAGDPQAIFGLLVSRHVSEFVVRRLEMALLAQGKRSDFVRAVFYTGTNDFLSMMRRAEALQAFIGSPSGADLLAGFKRAANILKKENWQPTKTSPKHDPLPQESALIAALDTVEPEATKAVEAEDFEAAMAALARLRGPVDAFFDHVTVNDPDKNKREARLNLLARVRDAVHRVADFSKIEG
ncbi:MAG: glycine--tRNA ligase subunit beta [Sphingosinicella sp.]